MIVVDFMIEKLDGGQFVAGVSFARKHEVKKPIKVGSVYVDNPDINSYTRMTEHICYLALQEILPDCNDVLFVTNTPAIIKGRRLERILGVFAPGKTLRFRRRKDLGTLTPDLMLLGDDAIKRQGTIFAEV